MRYGAPTRMNRGLTAYFHESMTRRGPPAIGNDKKCRCLHDEAEILAIGDDGTCH